MEIGRIFLVTQCPKKMSREYKKQLILLLKDMLLKEIDISLPKSTPALKIKRSHKLLPISHAPQTHSSGIVYVVLVVPMLVLFIVGIFSWSMYIGNCFNSKSLNMYQPQPKLM